MKNKHEIFALVIISVFIMGVFLIGPKYTGFVVLEGGEKIYVTEAIYDGENVTEDIIYLDEEYVEVVVNKPLSINFSDNLENNSLLNMFLSFEKDNSSLIIYDINNITAGYIDPYEIYPNETIVEEVKWYNKTLNLSSPQNKLFIEVTKEIIFDYIEAVTTTTTTTTSTTTTTIAPSSSESSSGSEKPANKVFIYTREEESNEEEVSEEETESKEVVEEAKIEPPQIQAEVVKEQEKEFVGEAENSNFETVGNTIIRDVETLTLVKFLVLIVCVSLLFVIYFKYRIKIKKMIKR